MVYCTEDMESNAFQIKIHYVLFNILNRGVSIKHSQLALLNSQRNLNFHDYFNSFETYKMVKNE